MYDENKNEVNNINPTLGDAYKGYESVQKLYDRTRNNSINRDIGNKVNEKTKDVAQKTTKEVTKETAQNAAKQTTKATTEAATASTGYGTVAVAIEKTLDAVDKALSKGISIITQDENTSLFKIILIAFLGLIILLPTLVQDAFHGMISAPVQSYMEDQYGNSKVKGEIANDTSGKLKLRFFSTDEGLSSFDYEKPYENALQNNILVLNKAFETSYQIAQLELKEIIEENGYNEEHTFESFYNNTYPFENINYAEILSILSQKKEYSIELLTWDKFNELFFPSIENSKLQFLYCMKVEDDYFEEEYEIEEYNTYLGKYVTITRTRTVKYGKVTLKPYDLKSLYSFLELDPTSINEHYNICCIDMTDTQENYLRFIAQDVNLGPNVRSIWDWGFERHGYLGIADFFESWNIDDIIDKIGNLPEGSNMLTNFLELFYRNQGDIQNLSGLSGLCNFTTYMMIAQYYSNTSLTNMELAELAKKWCRSDGFFTKQGDCLNQYGFSVSGNIKNNLPETIQNSIDKGNPLILHCRGKWVGTNGVYHNTDNGHFLLIHGYTEEGILVADPGKRANNNLVITWNDLAVGNDIYVRTTEPS